MYCYVIINDDELFREAVCGSQIIINKEPTTPPSGKTGWVHYNMENSSVTGREVWDVKKLLEVGNGHRFEFFSSFGTVCLNTVKPTSVACEVEMCRPEEIGQNRFLWETALVCGQSMSCVRAGPFLTSSYRRGFNSAVFSHRVTIF